VVALAGILIIFLSMTFTYNPLRNLFRKVRAYQDNPLKTDNEFQQIGQMLDQMQQDNQRLRQILHENESDVRLAFLTDLLNGLVEDEAQLEQRSLAAGVNLNGTAFAALSILVEGSRSFEDLFQNLPDDVLAFDGCRLHALRSTGDRAVPVLAVLDDADPAHYAHCIDQLQKTAAAGGLLITIGAGNLVAEPLQLGRSWQQAGEALSYRFVAGKGTVVLYSDMNREQRVLPWYPHQEIDALIRGITNGQTDEISRAVESVTRQIREQNLGIFAARCLSYDLINTVVRVVVSQNIRTDVIEEQLLDMISLPQTETIQQLGAYLVDFSTRLSEQLGRTRDARLDKILRYLDDHYRDSAFSVYNMAADLNISYSYLNRLFNNHTGQSVLDYLTDKRMEWVKQQLRETAQPIRQIIIDAGYNDIPNFSRKFKQREGISPRQYREQYNHNPPGDQANR
jgi:AraC-like DNA-binding protein